MLPLFTYRTSRFTIACASIASDAGTLALRSLPGEAEYAERFTSEARRREWLAWRILLQEVMPGAAVEYDPEGIPRFTGAYSGKFLSVSHARDIVALMVSDTPCGIDVEALTRRFDRAAGRFVAPAEAQLIDPADNRTYARLWCGKEALYKWARISGVNLRDEVSVYTVTEPQKPDTVSESFPYPAGRMTGAVRGRPAQLTYLYGADYCLAWCEG